MKISNFVLAKPEESFIELADCNANDVEFWQHLERHEDNIQAVQKTGIGENDAINLFDETTRPNFYKSSRQSFLLFLRAINLNPQSEPEDMVSLRFWFDGNKLITVMNRQIQAVGYVKESIANNKIKVSSSKEIFTELIHQILIRIERHVQKLSDGIEILEEKVESEQSLQQSEIYELKRATSRLWRYMHPQLDTLKKLSLTDIEWMDLEFRHQIKDFVDTMSYLNEELTLIKERCDILNNEITGALNSKVSRNLYIISVITVIFLPLTFITGLLGINVGGIPAANSENGFAFVSAIVLALLIVQIILLKIFRWF